MFNNIGGKIKALASVVCWIGIGASVLGGIATFAFSTTSFYRGVDLEALLAAILVMAGGALCSWIGSFLLYGYGELIDKTAQTAENTRKLLAQHAAEPPVWKHEDA